MGGIMSYNPLDEAANYLEDFAQEYGDVCTIMLSRNPLVDVIAKKLRQHCGKQIDNDSPSLPFILADTIREYAGVQCDD